MMRIDVRSVNTETSQIEYVETVEGKADRMLNMVGELGTKVNAGLHLPQIAARVPTLPNGTGAARPAATQSLGAMLDGIHDNSQLVGSIAQATREQSTSLSELSGTVRQIDEMTQHNAALVEETNAAIEQTEAQANELDRLVEVFVVEEVAADRPRRAA